MSQGRWVQSQTCPQCKKPHGASQPNHRHRTRQSPNRVSSSPIRYRSKSPEEIRLSRERFGDMSPGATNPPMEITSRSPNVRPQSQRRRRKESTPPPMRSDLIPHYDESKIVCYPADTPVPVEFTETNFLTLVVNAVSSNIFFFILLLVSSTVTKRRSTTSFDSIHRIYTIQ